MQNILLKGDIFSLDGTQRGYYLRSEGKTIKEISPKKPSVKKTTTLLCAKGCTVLPGFIDIHLHGEPLMASRYFAKFGTTSFLSTIPTLKKSRLLERIAYIKNVKDACYTTLLGVHLEGPFINREMAGAQNSNFIRNVDLEEAASLISSSEGLIKIMSLAPELRDAKVLIKMLNAHNIVPSLGHTNATFGEAQEAIGLGARLSTHTFNRMGPMHQRAPGAAGAVLTDERVFCEIILDGVHVHPAMFKILLRCKGSGKIVLSTDSVRFEDSLQAAKKGNVYRLKNGTIAGSSLTMNVALKNAITSGNLSLKDAVGLVTINQARLLGIDKRKGSLEAGKDADIVIVDEDFKVRMTICEGRIVYQMKPRLTERNKCKSVG